MRLLDIFDLYNLISRGSVNVPARKQTMLLRKVAFDALESSQGLTKLAFDTRRVNQETDYIPRRGLQNYHRSEKFVSDAIALKIESFTRLAGILDQLKIEYGREPEWQDSYTRILASAINKGLRTDQLDEDFSDTQPSMASLSYLEELMYVRYRLTPESMMSMSDSQLRTALLSKDETLVSQGIHQQPIKINSEITPTDISKFSYDDLMGKMLSTLAQVMSSYKPPQADDNLTSKLFDVKATKDSPEIERTVTITIKDKVLDKVSSETPINKVEAIVEEPKEEED